MKTIGLIGGMSYKSTADYYRIINQKINEHFGGYTSAKIVLFSVNFAQIEEYQRNRQWDESAFILTDAARKLESIGADMIALCTNTMHIVADQIQKELYVPFIHIADVTARKILGHRIMKVGLIATRYTMEMDFYVKRLGDFGLEVEIPSSEDRQLVNDVIFNELVHGVTKPESKQSLLNIVEELAQCGCEGIILGCTEVGMLIKKEDTKLPLFDTTLIHCESLVQLAVR